jgi:hypothetical protein
MKNRIFGIVIDNQPLEVIYKFYNELFSEISKNFDNFYVIDLSDLVFFQNKKGEKKLGKNLFPKNFIYKRFSNLNDLTLFLKSKNLIAINNLGKNPDYFWVLRCLKKNNVKLINILNTGEIGIQTTVDFSKRSFINWKNFYNRGFYLIFRILVILNILPKIEITFHSNIEVIKRLNNSFTKNFDKIFPFFKISYVKEFIKINSRSTTLKRKKNRSSYILFIDCPIMSGDRLIFEKINSKVDEKNFYKNLILFLKNLSKLYKKKIIISLHPKYKNKYLQNTFRVASKPTREMIDGASLVVFSVSGAIIDAVLKRKKIINFYSKLQGDFQLEMNKKYVEKLNLYSINLDEKVILNKKKINKYTKQSFRAYDKFIKSRLVVDGNINPNKKIIKILKKKFFYL